MQNFSTVSLFLGFYVPIIRIGIIKITAQKGFCSFCFKKINNYSEDKKQFSCCEQDYHESCFQRWLREKDRIQDWYEDGESVKKVQCPCCEELFVVNIMEVERSRVCAFFKYLKDHTNLDFVKRNISCELLTLATIFVAGGATLIGICLLNQPPILADKFAGL